jgi:RNA polymerase sigma factor (sigma-70 family)
MAPRTLDHSTGAPRARPAGRTAPVHEPAKTTGADPSTVGGSEADWVKALHGERGAFERVVTPHLGTLLDAAVRELRYHNALGDFGGDSPTAEEVVGEVLIRAWRDRKRRPGNLSTRSWLLGLLFRVIKDLIRRELRFHAPLRKSLEGPPPPPTWYDDDEGFWEWYQPDEAEHFEDLVGDATSTPEEMAIADDHFAHALPPRERQALMLHDVHGVPMPEVAMVLGVSEQEAWRILSQARRSLGETLSEPT